MLFFVYLLITNQLQNEKQETYYDRGRENVRNYDECNLILGFNISEDLNLEGPYEN